MSKKNATVWIVGALLLSMSTGCARGDTMVDPNDPNNAQTTDTTTTPTTTPVTNNDILKPGGSTGQVQAPVTATVTWTMKRNWKTLFLSKIVDTATVKIENPSNQNATGKVTVTFSLKGNQTQTIDKPFSVGPAGSTTIDNILPTQSADEATVIPVMESTTGTTGTTGTNSGWPATGGTTGSGTTGSGSSSW